MSQGRIRDLVGDRLDFLTVFITGVTPNSLNALITEIDAHLTSEMVTKLCDVALLAMGCNRAKADEFLSRANNVDIMRIVTDHFSVQGRMNFTALNLLGHLLLAGGPSNNSTFVREFRKKLGGQSIWHVNIARSELSDKQKEILEKKVRKMPSDVTIPIAREIVQKLVRKKTPPADTPNVPAAKEEEIENKSNEDRINQQAGDERGRQEEINKKAEDDRERERIKKENMDKTADDPIVQGAAEIVVEERAADVHVPKQESVVPAEPIVPTALETNVDDSNNEADVLGKKKKKRKSDPAIPKPYLRSSAKKIKDDPAIPKPYLRSSAKKIKDDK